MWYLKNKGDTDVPVVEVELYYEDAYELFRSVEWIRYFYLLWG